ncbi:BRO-like protein [Clostridium carnis]|uniref:BRO-like protein n=1 Tax=Clostridium carnis TaxID=1530 RepID=A0ABY6T178_9CLOT|nr:BRO family protein [Clostridium carnis]VDG74665.1 BRO-like protein [Clostridium carnis]
MSKEIQKFNNNQFGNLEILIVDGIEYFPATDSAKMLGYANPQKAIRDHCKGVNEMVTPTKGGQQKKNYITEGNLYRLIINSKLPQAEKFESWVFDEVLPQIRKTGQYNAESSNLKDKEIEARYNNSLARKANLYLKIATINPNLPKEYVQVLQSKAAETLNDGNMVIPLPKAERKTYSAKEIGEQLGISPNKVGRLGNENNLKTDEYGIEVWDKSKYSNKEVQTFRYYDSVIPVFKKLLRVGED